MITEYEDAKGTLANPSVSYIGENKEVKYDKVNPTPPPIDEVWVPLGFSWNDTRTGGVFSNDTISSIPLADTSELTDFSYMFRECFSLTSVPPIDTSKGGGLIL